MPSMSIVSTAPSTKLRWRRARCQPCRPRELAPAEGTCPKEVEAAEAEAGSIAEESFNRLMAQISLALTRGSITAYSTSTTKFTTMTMVASSMTQLRTTMRSRLEMDWKINRPRPGR